MWLEWYAPDCWKLPFIKLFARFFSVSIVVLFLLFVSCIWPQRQFSTLQFVISLKWARLNWFGNNRRSNENKKKTPSTVTTELKIHLVVLCIRLRWRQFFCFIDCKNDRKAQKINTKKLKKRSKKHINKPLRTNFVWHTVILHSYCGVHLHIT